MRVLVDITHPVHVHLFKNLIWTLQNEGHDVLVTACEKDVAVELLRQYGIAHCCTGSYGRSVARKAMSVPSMDWELLRLARRFRPDVLLAEAPVRASHAAFFLRRPCIGLDDTEHAKLQRWLWLPFVTKILTPSCYRLNLGRKQLRYDGYKELAYLHPKYFTPDPDIPVEYGLAEGEAFAFVRFVSWNASHDIGQGGFSRAGRIRLVRELSRQGRVLVSSESPLSEDLAPYAFTAPPHLIHHFLHYASVCVTEGATVASECAVLGTPTIYMNSLALGYLDDQEESYGLVFNFHQRGHEEAAIATAVEVSREGRNRREEWRAKAARLVGDHVDVKEYIVDAILKVGSVESK